MNDAEDDLVNKYMYKIMKVFLLHGNGGSSGDTW